MASLHTGKSLISQGRYTLAPGLLLSGNRLLFILSRLRLTLPGVYLHSSRLVSDPTYAIRLPVRQPDMLAMVSV